MRMSPPEVLRSCRTISFAQSNTTTQRLSMPGFRQRTRRGQRAPVALGGDELRGEVAPDRIGRHGAEASTDNAAYCVAGAERHVHPLRDWSEEPACGRDEVVRRCGAGGEAAEAGGLLVARGGARSGIEADAGGRVGSLQGRNRGQTAGAAAGVPGDESADAGGRGSGYRFARKGRGTRGAREETHRQDEARIRRDYEEGKAP